MGCPSDTSIQSDRNGTTEKSVNKAHTIRAFLFATATTVRFHPRRSSNPRSHRLRLSVFVLAQRSVARAPWISQFAYVAIAPLADSQQPSLPTCGVLFGHQT